ncbi:lysophospholipid acyltransferase family protein [Parabacteroides chinchillae]|uniref:KDO2-lipid IV(A) lauroyltransferase n=1 Tax=Parabacteroides chinchillae TaxID=871327 RepID=A0A8G2BXL8_9BACT|nr:lysophospholipid acyltransferase family protein [Parabacteroides chinchillae]SEG07302.1 KDO2-lipid IV(A) lauroyltransferase [Parabacteroides chinchillae]
MLTKLLYTIIYILVKLLAIFPMCLLYLLSDILYLLIYKVIKYRLKIVRGNMKASFPEKSEEELLQLEKKFYHHFADYIVETIKLADIPLEELQRRAYIKNPELIDQLMKEGFTCVIMLMGHYGNWEWFSGSTSRFDSVSLYQIYRPLNNVAVDRLFIKLRTRFGSFGIKKRDAVRDIIKLKQDMTRSLVIFIADQTPSEANLHYWTNFLNQDTPMLTGPERIAQKLNLPVVFLDVEQVKRGYYTVNFTLLTKIPKKTPEFWITEEYARLMEKSILRNPAYWLWTHKRWKYKRHTEQQINENGKQATEQ